MNWKTTKILVSLILLIMLVCISSDAFAQEENPDETPEITEIEGYSPSMPVEPSEPPAEPKTAEDIAKIVVIVLYFSIIIILCMYGFHRLVLVLLFAINKNKQIDKVIGIESRGFIFGAPLAYLLGCGFVPVRKPGKLPAECESEEYTLEYGTDKIEIHKDAIEKGDKVLIVDDLIATAGTAKAARNLVKKLGGDIVECAFIIELIDLKAKAFHR